MKRKIFISIPLTAITVAVLLLNACKKDDTTPPVISLSGSTSMTQSLPSSSGGGSWTDPGYSASDDKDGTVSVSVSGTVDPNKKGNYTITYSATDKAGNSISATRTVAVVNDAEVFAGAYNNSIDSCVKTPPSGFNATVTTSDSVNNLIWINNFGAYGTTINIKATITTSSIDVPINQSLGGTATITSFITANSLIVSATAPTKFTVNYGWTDGLSNDVCKSWYIR